MISHHMLHRMAARVTAEADKAGWGRSGVLAVGACRIEGEAGSVDGFPEPEVVLFLSLLRGQSRAWSLRHLFAL